MRSESACITPRPVVALSLSRDLDSPPVRFVTPVLDEDRQPRPDQDQSFASPWLGGVSLRVSRPSLVR